MLGFNLRCWSVYSEALDITFFPSWHQLNSSPDCYSYNTESCIFLNRFFNLSMFWRGWAFINLFFFFTNYTFQLGFHARDTKPMFIFPLEQSFYFHVNFNCWDSNATRFLFSPHRLLFSFYSPVICSHSSMDAVPLTTCSIHPSPSPVQGKRLLPIAPFPS